MDVSFLLSSLTLEGNLVPIATVFLKRLSSLHAKKHQWQYTYNTAFNFIHCYCSISLLKSTIRCLHRSQLPINQESPDPMGINIELFLLLIWCYLIVWFTIFVLLFLSIHNINRCSRKMDNQRLTIRNWQSKNWMLSY